MVHMAAYLAWIIRRRCYNPEITTQEQVDAIGRAAKGNGARWTMARSTRGASSSAAEQ